MNPHSNEAPEEEIERLLREHGGLLRRAIVRFCPRHLGLSFDDIEQEARVRLWRALESERKITNPPSYVYRVAMTTTLDAVRKLKSEREDRVGLGEDLEQVAQHRGTGLERPGASPEEAAHRAQVRATLERALARLGERRRKAVRLHLQGFTNQEVGDLLGWSEPKARNLIYRGLDDLRRSLREEGIDLGSA